MLLSYLAMKKFASQNSMCVITRKHTKHILCVLNQKTVIFFKSIAAHRMINASLLQYRQITNDDVTEKHMNLFLDYIISNISNLNQK